MSKDASSFMERLSQKLGILEGIDDGEAPRTFSELEHRDRRQRSIDDLEVFERMGGNHLIYCELCDTVFVILDIFHDHREASTDPLADDETDGWPAYHALEPGDSFPPSATVGYCEPCEPTDLTVQGSDVDV